MFGEQIGWFGPEIIKRPECRRFLRDCIELRRRLNRYFYAGRMARPPKLIGDVPKVTADWQWHGEWPITTNAIMAGAWELENDNKIVLLFANVSDKALSIHIEFAVFELFGGFTLAAETYVLNIHQFRIRETVVDFGKVHIFGLYTGHLESASGRTDGRKLLDEAVSVPELAVVYADITCQDMYRLIGKFLG